MERYAPNAKDLASRDVVSRAMTIEIREGRGVGPSTDHIHLHLEHLGPEVIHERLPGIAETARIFAGVDVTKEPIPVLPTVHYNMGGIPCNVHGEVVTLENGNPRTASCRGSWPSARPPASRCTAPTGSAPTRCSTWSCSAARPRAIAPSSLKPGAQHRPLAKDAGDLAVSRLDRLRNAKGPRRTAEIRLEMQKIMQRTPPCSARASRWTRACSSSEQTFASFARRAVSDRSLIWNTDLVETMELENLLLQAHRHHPLRREPQGKPRRACARGLSRARRRELAEAHAGLGGRAAARCASTIARCT